jgi:hypothetical protein
VISFWAERALAFTAMLGIAGIWGAKDVRADVIDSVSPNRLGATSATIGLTPIQDSTIGFGRFFLDYTLGGNYNATVFWIDSSSEQPFTVNNDQFTFVPGIHTYPTEQLVISAEPTCCIDDFSLWVGENLFDFNLPSTVVANPNGAYTRDGGDEFYLFDVPATVYSVPALPESSSLEVLAAGFAWIAALLCLTHLRIGARGSYSSRG